MSRPRDWHVLDMGEDPTPGDPHAVRVLARSAGRMAADAADAHAAVRSLAGDGAVLSWVGLAGDVFRGALEDFPVQLAKLEDSYDQAAEALGVWATRLDDVQSNADRALEQGRQARAEIEALSAQLASARAAASSAAAHSNRLADQPAGGAPPSPEAVRAAAHGLAAAQQQVSSLSSSLAGAQSRLEAAKRMAEQARDLRRESGRSTRQRLYAASDAGIEPKSRWEKFKEAVAKAWEITVKVATVVTAVLCVVAIFAGGPLVWGVLFAMSAVLLADSLARYARGEGSLWEVGLNMLGVIPGGRLLGAAGKLIGRSAQGARALSAGARGLAAGRTAIAGMTRALRSGAGRFVSRIPVGDAGHLTLRAGRAADNLPPHLRKYVDRVRQLGVRTEPGTANFYSGGRGKARQAAEEHAGRTGTTTLENTPGGRWLDEEGLYVEGRTPLSSVEADRVWRQTSREYAEQASGDVRAFTYDPWEKGVWAEVEYPTLVRGMDEGRVTSITVEDVQTGRSVTWRPGHAPPGGWKCP